MLPAPKEYLHGTYASCVRRRFELVGTRDDADGTVLLLKCRRCGHDLDYDWLKKPYEQAWTGDFGKKMKLYLAGNWRHKNCHKSTEGEQLKELQVENERLRNRVALVNNNTITNNNIVIVNLPAVTRIGSTGVPLMCSDIPYPDAKTVRALLDIPEAAVSGFVIQRYFNSDEPSISAPDPSNKRLRVVQRDKHGNHWVEAPLESTVDNIVYKTLDTLDDEFDAMKHKDFKEWKRREGLTAIVGFDKTDAYQKLQDDVAHVLKAHGPKFESVP